MELPRKFDTSKRYNVAEILNPIALEKIHAPQSLTTMLGLMFDNSILIEEARTRELDFDINIAKEKVSYFQKAIENCQSDAAYWGLLSERVYWEAVLNILEAGKLTNDNIPEVEAPDLNGGILMDMIGKVEKFGKDVLAAAKQTQ